MNGSRCTLHLPPHFHPSPQWFVDRDSTHQRVGTLLSSRLLAGTDYMTTDRGRLATPLLCAEVSFLVALAVFASIFATHIKALRRQIPQSATLSCEELGSPSRRCSLPVQAGSSVAIPRSSFTVLEWSSTVPSAIPKFRQEDAHSFSPSALLDEDTVVSCFTFDGSRGGVLLVSNSEKYRITKFTINNSLADSSGSLWYNPKEGALWGLLEGKLPGGLENTTTSFVTEHATYVLIGNFCFDLGQGPAQTFVTEADVAASPAVKFSAFYIEISSNWGGSYTCVCRLTLYEGS